MRLLVSWVGVTVVLTVFLFALIEGGASLLLVVYDHIGSSSHIAEEYSTQHDPELGWVSKTNVDLPDFYGPGRGLRTEIHGFRNKDDVRERLQEGRLRFVCSGDSFTLGYGVGNDDTWCQLLGGLANVETVNMGQGGYGVDQAYMWYMRDGLNLDHQLHLFAFIDADFRRAQSLVRLGFQKPMLEIVDGELVTTNVPVPRDSKLRDLQRKLATASAELRLARLLKGIRARVVRRVEGNQDGEGANARTVEMLGKMFERLATVNREKASHLVLVNVPTKDTHTRVDESFWQRSVRELSDSLGIIFIDLVPKLQELPGSAIESLFIQPGELQYRGADGHYTREGNRWFADALLTELRRVPELDNLHARNGDEGR